ncbi:hypothetical protein D917_09066, partial [Trichinella nativa]
MNNNVAFLFFQASKRSTNSAKAEKVRNIIHSSCYTYTVNTQIVACRLATNTALRRLLFLKRSSTAIKRFGTFRSIPCSELSRSLPQADRQAGRQPELAQLPASRMFQSSKTAWL